MGKKKNILDLHSAADAAESDLKKCKKCGLKKQVADFYSSRGKTRGECKKCTIKKNVRYQQKIEAWKHRWIDEDRAKSYSRDYYEKNKQKYKDYRRKFKEENPWYYKEYLMKKKNQVT